MELNSSFASHTLSGPAALQPPLEWAVCPGATEDVYTSPLPHGTIITANSFTSVYLLRVELSSWERVQYEVHLLSGGLLQIGWCVTASGLPFTTNEGVGDFPFSVAADGCRGMLWNLTGERAPSLRWKPGDILGCSADFAQGTFDFHLNGVHCCSASLPTKGALLRQGAKWYTDRYSTDEMLAYSPAMSLAEGEAALVNLGEAPFRYPRASYASLQMLYHSGSSVYAPAAAAATVVESGSSGVVRSPTGSSSTTWHPSLSADGSVLPTRLSSSPGAATSLTPRTRSSLPNSFSSRSTVRAGLGGSDLEDLFYALGIHPSGGDDEAGPLELLARCIVAPERRVAETVLTLVSWFEADTQSRWRAFCMVLYLWVVRFYCCDIGAQGSSGNNNNGTGGEAPPPYRHPRLPVVGAEPIARMELSLSVEGRRRLLELIHGIHVFLPPDHFPIVPGILVAVVQHRMGNGPGAQEKAARIVCDLASVSVFRRAWARDTGNFCSTLLNLCALCTPSAEELGAFAQRIAQHTQPSASSSPHTGRASNRQAIQLLASARPLCARQTTLWLLVEQCVEHLTADEECHGALVTALLRFLSDSQLRSPVDFASPLRIPRYNDSLPFTFSLYLQPAVACLLVLSIASALGKTLLPEDDTPCLLADADPLGGLRWRDVALKLLPTSEFCFRRLTGYGLMPKGWPDIRVGGSFHHVRSFVEAEEIALRHDTQTRGGAEVDGTEGMGGRAHMERESEGEREEGEGDRVDGTATPLPAAVTRRIKVTPATAAEAPKADEGTNGDSSVVRLAGSSTLGEGKDQGDTRATPLPAPPCEDAAYRDDRSEASVSPISLYAHDSRYWQSHADAAEALRGRFAELNVGNPQVDSAGVETEVALAERAKALLLVTTMAVSLFVRPVLGATLGFLDSFNDAVQAYTNAYRLETAGREDAGSGSGSTSLDSPSSGLRDEAAANDSPTPCSAHDRLRAIVLSVIPLATMMEQSALQGLSAYAAAASKTVSYYWSRMALFERLYAVTDTVATAVDGDSPVAQQLWRQELQEAEVCPPRAFLMLPLVVVEASVDLWLFCCVARQGSASVTEQYPGLLLTCFDAVRRRSISPSQTRSYLYRAMASLLGFGAESRLRTSRVMLEQEKRYEAINEAARRGGDGEAGKGALCAALTVPALQGSVVDCLDAYICDENYNDAAVLNFLFALSQEDGCLLPPPRMLDETFWWCLSPSNTPQPAGQEGGGPPPPLRPTADEIYFDSFCHAVKDVNLLQCSTQVVSKCNRLLTQFSQLRPMRSTQSMTTADVKAFHAKYILLRKSLYVLDFILRAQERNEAEEEEAAAGAGAAGARGTLATSAARSRRRARRARVADAEGIPVKDFLRLSQRETVFSALMDVITQCLVRISFQRGEGPRAAKPNRESAGGDPVGSSVLPSEVHWAASGGRLPFSMSRTPLTQPLSRSARTPSVRASSADAEAGSQPSWSDNVLLPARSQAVDGHYVCFSAPCTVTGLLSPIFNLLHRIFTKQAQGSVGANLFLSVTSDPDVLLSRALALLEHPAWWADAPLPPSNGEPGGAFGLSDEDEYLPSASQAVLRELQEKLRALKDEADATRSRPRTAHHVDPCHDTKPPPPKEEEEGGGTDRTSASPVRRSETTRFMGATAINRRRASPSGGWRGEQEDAAEHKSDVSGDEDGADPSQVCLICLERPADLVMKPCGHRCCHLCFSRSRETPERRVCMPSTANTITTTAAAAAPSDARLSPDGKERADDSRAPSFLSFSGAFTLRWDAFAPAASEPRGDSDCFFCKGAIERVVTAADGDGDGEDDTDESSLVSGDHTDS